MEIDKQNLEEALSKIGQDDDEEEAKKCCKDDGEDCKCESEVSKQEEIGFHKGALNTLVGERNELIKMVQAVESIMQAHLKKLEELGVKIEAQEKK